jgi:hypothetical protein
MGPFQELLATDYRRVWVFVMGLRDVSEPGVDQQSFL